MGYKLVKNITNVNYEKGNKGRKYIVIHFTGNKADTAAANANYFKSVNRGASAHFFVDKTQVVQVVDESNTAWAVGKNYGSNNLFGKCTNYNSISIEMCSDNGKIADATYNNTVELTKSLMKKYNIPASNVVRHWDVCSKACPGWSGWGANGKDASIWNKFKKDISTSTSSTTSSSASDHGGTSGHYWATIQLKELDRTDGQKWIVHKHTDGTYSLKNKASVLYASVRDGKMQNDQEIWGYSWNNTKSQRFYIDLDDSGDIAAEAHIHCYNNQNMVVEVDNGSYADGARIQIHTDNDTYAQKWTFIPTGHSEEYYILNFGSGKALDIKYK